MQQMKPTAGVNRAKYYRSVQELFPFSEIPVYSAGYLMVHHTDFSMRRALSHFVFLHLYAALLVFSNYFSNLLRGNAAIYLFSYHDNRGKSAGTYTTQAIQ